MSDCIHSFIQEIFFSVFSMAGSVPIYSDLSGEEEGRVCSPWHSLVHGVLH